jgi:WXXGXW repeat (2 copies)
MKFNKPLAALVFAASLAGVTQSSVATAEVRIFLNNAPPALRYEAVPSPRRGYTWAPGYWDSNRSHHAWRSGSWQRNRSGHYYVEPRWTQRDNGWQLERGRWNRGYRDRDGVPNNRDRAPDNPYRR